MRKLYLNIDKVVRGRPLERIPASRHLQHDYGTLDADGYGLTLLLLDHNDTLQLRRITPIAVDYTRLYPDKSPFI